MSEKVAPRPSSEPEEVLDYDFVRVRMPNRAEQQRRRREEAKRRLAAAAAEAEQARADAAFWKEREMLAAEKGAKRELCRLRAEAEARRRAVRDHLSKACHPLSDVVDASKVDLKSNVSIHDLRGEEDLANSLLDRYRLTLPGYDVFPVFIGIRLCLGGQWGHITRMNSSRCYWCREECGSESRLHWDQVMSLFGVLGGSGRVPKPIPEFPAKARKTADTAE
jgi:hypothetical protein